MMKKERTAAIYLIECTETGHYYIGCTQDLTFRIRCHFSQLKLNKHTCRNLQAEFNEHKKGSFVVEIIAMKKYMGRCTYEVMGDLKRMEKMILVEIMPVLNNAREKGDLKINDVQSKFETGKRIPVSEILTSEHAA